MGDSGETRAGLEDKLRLLLFENEMLAERAEDSLLLGLIGESLGTCDDPMCLDETALEQVAVLKDLAAGLCVELVGDRARVLSSFVTYADRELDGSFLPRAEELEEAVASGAIVETAGAPAGSFSRALVEGLGVPAHAWCGLPAGHRAGRKCRYVFVDAEGDPRLPNVMSMLRRTVDMVQSRRENLALLAELREVNASLDRLVEARTSELSNTNDALRREIDVRMHAERDLRESLAEKTVLLREVHHRVKNNLQIVSSLLSIQASEITDETLRMKFAESQERIRAMSLIHERLYMEGDMASIEFGEYLQELTRDLAEVSSKPGVVATVEADRVELSLEQAIPCGLAANKLVSNAYKHAFAGRSGGRLSIRLSRAGESEAELVVEDDGVGLPGGKGLEELASIGITLVLSLSAQLRGSVRAENGPGGAGTRFVLRFPIKGSPAKGK